MDKRGGSNHYMRSFLVSLIITKPAGSGKISLDARSREN